jgi:hypothetical protein
MQNIIDTFGQPGESNLVTMSLPYPMRLAWDLSTRVNKMRCHKLLKQSFDNTFIALQNYYGRAGLEELGIDIFGGCYNYRKMRGGSKLSLHSWGIAIDLHPEMNQLKWDDTRALFATPDYERMIEIFDEHGFDSLGRLKNYDWMHFQAKL